MVDRHLNPATMPFLHVDSDAAAEELKAELSGAERIALDCEAAGFHRYANRLCLVQISTEERTFVLDPLSLNSAEILRDTLERPDLPIVMHGADFDLRLLRADLDIRLRGLFDTQIAAGLLGETGLGLAALLGSRFGVQLSKKYQRADWADRPLTTGMLEYAANDTRYLLRLADELLAELGGAGRTEWASEECAELEKAADARLPAAEPPDPVARMKGARDLSPRQVTALRAALEWRDDIARARDRAAFRVIGDGPLIDAVAKHPMRVEELLDIKGFPRKLAQESGKDLLKRFQAVTEMPEDDLRPYPKPERRGAGRPTPEIEELADRLKAVRNQKADELGLARGILLANAVVLGVATAAPTTREALAGVPGMRSWKLDLLGEDFLSTIRGAV